VGVSAASGLTQGLPRTRRPDSIWLGWHEPGNRILEPAHPTGQQLAAIPLLGDVYCVPYHPRKPVIIAGDSAGNLHFLDLEVP
jgi:hypothetical protein